MKRNPNGYGTVTKLTGRNRRRPYAAYSDRYFVGIKPKRDVIGYFETEAEARSALAAWNRSRGTKMNATFGELFDEWFEQYTRTGSSSAVYAYSAAWKRLASLQKMKVRDVRAGHFQRIIDDMAAQGLSYSSISNVKTVCDFVENYAMQFDVIQQNYASFIRLPEKTTKEKERFTDDDLKKLSDAAGNGDRTAQIVMILCYSGWRIHELLSMQRDAFDPDTCTMRGGSKTKNGKDRIVPVQPCVLPYVRRFLADGGAYIFTKESKTGARVHIPDAYFRTEMFAPLLDRLGIRRADGSAFTPHATRHTFASLARKNGGDPLVIKKLLGHSPKSDVTEKVYTHVDLEQLQTVVGLLK